MIALTVRQPYASRIVQGTKRIENRTRSTSIRGSLLIHAGAAVHDRFRGKPMDHLPMAAVIGVVQLVGCHNAATCGDRCLDAGGEPPVPEAPNVFHWELSRPVAFAEGDVVPAKGMLGIWTVASPSVEHLVQLATQAAVAR